MPPVNATAPRAPHTLKMRDVDETPVVSKPAPLPVVDGKPEDRHADRFEGTSSGAPKKGIQSVDGKLSPRAQWAELPSDLKSKVSEKVWSALPQGQRSTLLSSYLSFRAAGVWQYVSKVTGEKEQRERPVNLPGGYQTHVAGNSGAIAYELNDVKAFRDRLIADNPQFGVDGGVMGALHVGQESVRESGPQPTSMHISIGPGNKMDAHLDAVNPVNTPVNGKTQLNPQKGVEHWSHEVLPEMLRKLYRVPGLIIEPTLKPGSKESPRPEGKITVSVELKGLEKAKPKIVNPQTAGSYDLPQAVFDHLAQSPELKKLQYPYPKGLTKSSAPDPRELARQIAMLAKESLEKGDPRIRLDLPSYAGQPGYQKAATAATAQITKLVLRELQAQGIDTSALTGVTVTYGKRNARDRFATEGETVAL